MTYQFYAGLLFAIAAFLTGYGESFNSIFRDDCLNRWAFYSVKESKLVVNRWLEKYNDYRPHGSLKGLTPNLFLEKWRQE